LLRNMTDEVDMSCLFVVMRWKEDEMSQGMTNERKENGMPRISP
jgi:hypothetical protein